MEAGRHRSKVHQPQPLCVGTASVAGLVVPPGWNYRKNVMLDVARCGIFFKNYYYDIYEEKGRIYYFLGGNKNEKIEDASEGTKKNRKKRKIENVQSSWR